MKTAIRTLFVCFALVVTVGASIPVPDAAAAFFYLKTEGPVINGESKQPQHKKWIEVQATVQDVSNPNGATPDVGRLVAVKNLDRASVELAYHAVEGTVFTKVTLERCETTGQDMQTILRVELQNARIVSVQPELTKAGDQETIAFDGFSQITWTYYWYFDNGAVREVVTRTVPGY